MTITTSAAHGRTLEALSRVATLLVEHRDHIPPVYLTVTSHGEVRVQIPAADTFSEPRRKQAVEYLARILHLDAPTVTAEGRHYSTHSATWTVFTPVHTITCTCGKPSVR